uniref:VWA domain-containing protein n=1 Tax=Thaumasiovibrio occultus TaxID=1891184 RepID=UPI000B35FEC3|nr:VWA domain-containing protein [Thaumasiovibrio occultus]
MAERLKNRWRMVLGRYCEAQFSANLSELETAQDGALTTLYQQGLAARGHKVGGTLSASQLHGVEWISEVERLFPKSVSETLIEDAVNHFQLTELLSDPQVLEKLNPNIQLLRTMLRIGAQHNPKVRLQVERIIKQVIDQLTQKLRPKFEQALRGRRNSANSHPTKTLANLNWRKTIQANLKHFDPDTQKVAFEKIYFHGREQRSIPWRVIMCIDQSGSMSESVIYSAVVAGILARLPAVRLHLVLFDTSVVDLSEDAQDPVGVLLASQMGGGTHIGKAWRYAESLVTEPKRTLVLTVSDFEEGGSPSALISQAHQVIQSGVKMLGLTALDQSATPFYDGYVTQGLQKAGMTIKACSPDHLADWLAGHMGEQG